MSVKHPPLQRIFQFLALVAAAVLAVACGGGGASSGVGGSGTLAVRLADAPDPTISAVNVTISRVEAHVAGQWAVVSSDEQTYNLLDLTEEDVLLGTTQLPAGRYNQVRLFITSATVTDSEGTHNVIVPSAAQTGLKINVHYDIEPDQLTTLLLDFNVDKSLIKQGNGQYRLQPVIPAVVKVLSGTITGVASNGSDVLHNASVRAVYASGTSYPVGTEVNTSSSMSDGGFKVWALLPGTYAVEFEWTDPNDPGVVLTKTVADVEVVASQNTNLGTVVLE